MTDITTIDLFRIHENPTQLAVLHRLQRERAEEAVLTGNDRPTGMRLSCADPIRRVKAALDSWWALTLDEGIGMRGHLLEDYLEVALLHGEYAPLSGKPYATQVPVQWHEQGRTAFDFVVEVNATDRIVSCKSSIHGGKPSTANYAQEKRMMALAGYHAGSEFEIWVIDPGTMRATGPYVHTLDALDIIEAQTELVGVNNAYVHFAQLDSPKDAEGWNDPEFWREAFKLEGSAFWYETLDASAAIEKRVRRDVRLYQQRKQLEADWKQHDRDDMRPVILEQIQLAQLADPTAKSVKAYSADEIVTYTLDARGAIRRTIQPVEASENAAHAA
jgi:hypothetical protein